MERKFDIIIDKKTGNKTQVYKTGEHIDKFSNSKIWRIITYKDGWQDGPEIIYNKQGCVISEHNYKIGILDGLRKLYHENGKIRVLNNYKKGKLSGDFFVYDEDGTTLQTHEIYNNGLKNGLQKYYYKGRLEKILTFKFDSKTNKEQLVKEELYNENGSIKKRTRFINNKFHGLCEFFSNNGNLLEKIYYENGIQYEGLGPYAKIGKDGIELVNKYYNNKKIREKYQLKKGIKDGYHKIFYENGQLKSLEHYKKGKKHGISYFYTSDGVLLQTLSYEKDSLSGEEKKYYKNADLEYSIMWKNGVKNGSAIYYYMNGNFKHKCTYKDNKLEGKYILYYDTGNIQKEVYYLEGKTAPDCLERNYNVDGNLKNEIQYENNWKKSIKEFDSKGEIKSYKEFYENGSEKNNEKK